MPPARSAPPRPRSSVSSSTGSKRAARLAEAIIEDVIGRGWPVGEVLGSETQLLERYTVSRAVFREAVRLLEHREVARTRRGPGGGLVVTEPTVEAVKDAVVLYLHRVDAPLDEVFEARIVFEGIASDVAARRLDNENRLLLRSFLEDGSAEASGDPRVLHNLLATSTHNPAIELFVEVLNRIAILYASDWQAFGLEEEMVYAHARIAEAVLTGEPATARRRMHIHLEAEADFLRKRRSTRQLLPGSILVEQGSGAKMAEAVARSIASDVIAAEMQPGQLVGTQAGLMARHGVSRAVLREAVRLLEHHHVAAMRRGPGGGLYVAEPTTEAVTDVAAIYLARRGVDLPQLTELRTAVELELVDLAVERLDDDSRATMVAARDLGADIHRCLAAMARNRVLELVALVLVRLSELSNPGPPVNVPAEASSGIAAAILDGDRDLARCRLRSYLNAPPVATTRRPARPPALPA